MSCRSTHAGSAFLYFGRQDNGGLLSDSACLSLFHELRRSYRGLTPAQQAQVSSLDYPHLINHMSSKVEASRWLSPKKKASLLRRLAAAETEPAPPPDMLFALSEIEGAIKTRTQNLEEFLREMGRRSRSPYDEVQERFKHLESRAPRERTHRPPSGFDADVENGLDVFALGREQGTLFAARSLLDETRQIEQTLFRQQPQRIQQMRYAAPIQVDGIENLYLTSAGYDPRNGRLEVSIRDASGEKTLYYRRVPPEAWAEMDPANAISSTTAGECWRRTIRGNERHAYATRYEALKDGVAPRCQLCGEFANARHGCPVVQQPRDLHSWTTRSRWSSQKVRTTQLAPSSQVAEGQYETVEVDAMISLPAARELRTAVEEGPVRIRDISYRHSQIYPQRTGLGVKTFTTTGDVVIWHDDDDQLQVNSAGLRCPCPEYQDNYDCQHVRDVRQAVLDRLPASTPSDLRRTAEEEMARARRAQERAQAAAAQDWLMDPDGRAEAAQTWRRDAESLYTEDFSAFKRALERAQERSASEGRPVIPFHTDNVLDGAARRGNGRAFGIEVEYEFPSEWTAEQRNEANSRVAKRLKEAGLTWSDAIQPPSAAKLRGFRDTQRDSSGEGNWTLETDGSVNGGELVSPGLYDEPESWTNLQKAIDIITEEGGVASKRAGLHVHVSTGDYSGDPLAYTELARLISQHEDVIYRLSTDPVRGTHRKGRFARPMPEVPPEGFRDATEPSRWQGEGKYWAANFSSVRGRPNDHPEFRVFDSSLDAGTIQAQVKMAVALTEAAKRQAATGPTSRGKEPIGSHLERRAGRRTRRPMTDEEQDADTATTRSLLDTLFRRNEDKDHLIAIFAHTKWSK